MKIQSVEELKKLKKESADKVGIRAGVPLKGVTEVTVGMATCGLAAGAEDVMKAISDEVKKLNIENVRIVKVGCIGFCYYEPIVQVNIPGKQPVFYGNVGTDLAKEIVRKHIASNECVDEAVITLEFDKA
jgi:NADP-reducing hydrogenase subunit HndB